MFSHNSCHKRKKIVVNGELKLSGLPFQEGDEVSDSVTPSPLRGKVLEYLDLTEPVAIEDWIAA